MVRLTAVVAAMMLGVTAPSSIAQVTGDDALVVVNVSNVANNLAKNLSVEVSRIPVTVQVPIDVAANVCGVDVSVLTSQATGGTANCDAKNESDELTNIVRQEIK
jgi:hypothetical protein